MDDFLPCIISQESEELENFEFQLAMKQSMIDAGIDSLDDCDHPHLIEINNEHTSKFTSSKFDPNSIADKCRTTLNEIQEFLHHDRWNKDPNYRKTSRSSPSRIQPLHRRLTTSDLAYSKARHRQLWVQFIEKAYAKMHGSYRAISGGHVAEAFLDLTGAPTAVYNFDHHNFNPRSFWNDLMEYRKKRLPMGCGTSSSQQGLVGMHAYSILDVVEIKNVGLEFFRGKLLEGTHGNVSGFTDFDGTVRLLRIRNPHGKGEWQGDFSDKSPIWENLMRHKPVTNGICDLTGPQSLSLTTLERTHVDDGKFWISYDDFLLGFTNVDVVLAFQGNHAKSFASNFPHKKSSHRCARAFELSAVARQPGEKETVKDDVEVYILGLQKTRRGASLGRSDRKKSYKASDLGILIGESQSNETDEPELNVVEGRFFGLKRNGHIRLILNRSNHNTKLIVMPISFGHPSATDEEMSFVLRFVADSPLLVQELPKPPKMNVAIQKCIFNDEKIVSLGIAGTSRHRGAQCTNSVLAESIRHGESLFKIYRSDFLADSGGTVLVYLVVNRDFLTHLDPSQQLRTISFTIEVNCRGMICRTANGLENHVVISKGKKFEAAWRRFNLKFEGETQSRLLVAITQAGEDYQMGSINCTMIDQKNISASGSKRNEIDYEEYGIFCPVNLPLFSIVSTTFQRRGYIGEVIPLTGNENADIEDDVTLQRAMQKSISNNQTECIDVSAVHHGDPSNQTMSSSDEERCVFSEDIEEAIKLSLEYK